MKTIDNIHISQNQIQFTPSQIVFDRKFNLALRKSHGISFNKRVIDDELTPDDKYLFKSCELHNIHLVKDNDNIIYNYNIWPSIYASIRECRLPDIKLENDIIRMIELNLNTQINWQMHNNEPSLKPNALEFTKNFINNYYEDKLVAKLSYYSRKMEELVMLLSNTEIRKNQNESKEDYYNRRCYNCYYSIPELRLQFTWSRNSAFIIHNSKCYLVPRIYILLIHNKLCDILSVLILSCFYSGTVYRPNSHEDTISMINELSVLAEKYQEKFFTIAKVLEAVNIGECLRREEGRDNSDFLRTVTRGLYESTQYEYDGSRMQLLYIMQTTPMMHELSCLSKIMGHPFVDVQKSALTLMQKTTEQAEISMDRVSDSVRFAKEDFIKKYIMRHGKWPKVELNKNTHKTLTIACMRNVLPTEQSIVLRHGKVKLKDYDQIDILKNMEFNPIECFLPYIKDKTISLLKNEVLDKYLGEHVKPDKTKMTSAEIKQYKEDQQKYWIRTRALLSYLLLPIEETSHVSYLREYMGEDWENVCNYLIIRIVPKEKEMKVEARGFGCKSLNDRARSIIQELNVANFLEMYSDEQAMTTDEITLIKKLYAYRNLKNSYKGYRSILINVDASSWNNRFRNAAVKPVMAETLDRIFNNKLFSKTHDAYENSFIYMPDIDEITYWDGQLGGIEGQNQDTWVYVYLNQIKVCLKQYPYPYYLLCKGDDLRINILVPPSALEKYTINTLKNRIMTSISEIGKDFHHTIKVEDSYASECYFAFSKNAFVNGVEQPQSYRKIQKCYGANNAFLSTIDDYVSSSFSNAHSASKTSPSPMACYGVALYWAYRSITQDNIIAKLTEIQKVSLTLIPNLLGGFPIIYLHNFYVRAESDLLPSYLDLLKYCFHYDKPMYESLSCALFQVVSPVQTSFRGFLVDPYSLPIKKPPNPSSILRKLLEEQVGLLTQNIHIKELYEAKSGNFMDIFLHALLESNVYNGKLFSAIYSCTPEAIIQALIRKFESGRSVLDAIVLKGGYQTQIRTLSKLVRAAKGLQMYRFRLMNRQLSGATHLVSPHWISSICSTELAQILRDTMWKRKVESITQPCMAHMLHIGSVEYFGVDEHAATNHFHYQVDNNNNNDFLFSIGKHTPFVGATTGTGVSRAQISLVKNNIIMEKVAQLLDLYNWCDIRGDVDNPHIISNLGSIVKQMIEMYTGKSVEVFVPFSGGKTASKTVQHHVRSNNYRISTVPNTLMNGYTHIVGNAYSHINYEHNPNEKRALNYYQVLCHTTSCLLSRSWVGQANRISNDIWTVTTPCKYCNRTIKETPVVIREMNFPNIPLSVITSIGSHTIKDIHKQLLEAEDEHYYDYRLDDALITLEVATNGVLQHYFDITYHNRMAMVKSYVEHSINQEGIDILSSWSHIGKKSTANINILKYAKIKDIFRSSAALTVQCIVKRLGHIQMKRLYTDLCKIPSEELPWMKLLSDMKSVGVYNNMIKYIKYLYPDYMQMQTLEPSMMAPLYGTLCAKYCMENDPITDVVVVTPLELCEVSKATMSKISSIRYHHYTRECEKLKRLINLQTLDNKIIVKYAEILIYVSTAITDVDKKYYFKKDDDGKVIETEIPLYDPDEETDEKLEECIMNPDQLLPITIALSQFVFKDHNISEIVESIVDRIDIYREDYKDYLYGIIKLHHYDIVSCIEKVESEYSVKLDKFVSGKEENEEIAIRHNNFKFLTGIDIKEFTTEDTFLELNISSPPKLKDVLWDQSLYNKRWLLRPYGASNISMSRLIGVFAHIGVEFLPDNINALALADGYGGYTSVISSMTHNSHITYNTLPNNMNDKPEPLVAIKISEKNNNMINTDALTKGHNNLYYSSTYQYIEKTCGLLSMVVFDAEVFDYNIDYYRMLYMAFTIFIRKGHKGSMFVCKLYIDNVSYNLAIIGRFREYMTQMLLTRIENSPVNGEIFLISTLRKPCQLQYIIQTSYPPIKVQNRYNNFHHKYIEDVRNDKGGTNSLKLNLYLPSFWYKFSSELPSYGFFQFLEKTKLLIPENLHYMNGYTMEYWLTQLLQYVHTSILSYEEEFTNQSADTAYYLYDTITHKEIMLYRYLQIKGFEHIINVWLNYETPILSVKIEKEAYDNTCNLLPNVILKKIRESEDGVIRLAKRNIDTRKHWMHGLRWGSSAINIGFQITN